MSEVEQTKSPNTQNPTRSQKNNCLENIKKITLVTIDTLLIISIFFILFITYSQSNKILSILKIFPINILSENKELVFAAKLLIFLLISLGIMLLSITFYKICKK